MANTITLSPVRDTYTSKNYPSTNYASSYGIYAGREPIAGGTPALYVSFIAFDMSSIPANKIITNVQLMLYAYGVCAYQLNYSLSPSEWASFPAPMVLRARKVDFTAAELSTLTYNGVIEKGGISNPYSTLSNSADSQFDIRYSSNRYVTIKMNNLEKSSEYVVAVFQDADYPWGVRYEFGSQELGASYTPKLVVTCDDYVPPKPTNLIPDVSTRNKSGDINFSWQWEDAAAGTTQASFQVLYSTNDFSTSTAITGTTNKYCTIPANSFTDEQTVKWKVKITDSNGDTSDYSDIASFTIGATVPSIPSPLSPVSTIVNSSDIVYFRWRFNDNYGYAQAKYDLEYKRGLGDAVTVSAISTATQCAIPANTLSGGDYSWRVRCYNAFDEVSEYCAWQPFFSIGKPAAPVIIEVSNNMHPTVKWTSIDQDLFIVKVYKDGIIYNSGEQASETANEFTIDAFLENGDYTVGIQYSNIYGFWSSETLFSFTINTDVPDKPTLGGNVNGLYTALIINSATTDNLIYRKGSKDNAYNLIATLNDNSFVDYTAPAGTVSYFVRAVTSDGFSDSDAVSFTMKFDGIVLSDYDNPSDYINLYKTKDVDKRKSISPTKNRYLINCNGRTYPVQQTEPFKNHVESHEYFISVDDYDKLYRILGCNKVYYRNNYGYGFIAGIGNTVITEEIFGYNTTFTLTRLGE